MIYLGLNCLVRKPFLFAFFFAYDCTFVCFYLSLFRNRDQKTFMVDLISVDSIFVEFVLDQHTTQFPDYFELFSCIVKRQLVLYILIKV